MDVVGQARADFDRGDWEAAYAGWSAVDLDTLTVADLGDLATAAELLGHHDVNVTAMQKAFVTCLAEDDVAGSVRSGFRIAMASAAHGEPALAAGWTARAEGLVADLPDDAIERGWVAFLIMFRHLDVGDFGAAAGCAAQATALGQRHLDPDLTAMGLCAQGRMALYSGDVAAGRRLLDEAMVRVLTGETSPVIAGHVYCTAIEGCQEISDFLRVAEWTAALDRWCRDQPGLLAFTGQCAVHRGQLLRLHGEWSRALEEFELAGQRYARIGAPDAAGLAAYEAGEVLRLRGDVAAADAAYERSGDHGFDPQPGLALLWLADGKLPAALSTVERLLGEPGGPVQRCRLLPAAVEVLVAAGQVDRAREVSVELEQLAGAFECAPLEAAAAHAVGSVEVASGDPAGALPYLRKAQQLWARVDVPYEQARARALAGRALAALGDREASRRELEGARTTLRRLGARPAADAVDDLLAPSSLPAGLSPREAEVLRLVARGRSNAQIAADLVLSEKTVARHLSNIFTKLDVPSRTAAAAYAYQHALA